MATKVSMHHNTGFIVASFQGASGGESTQPTQEPVNEASFVLAKHLIQ